MPALRNIFEFLQPTRRRLALYVLLGVILALMRFDSFPVGGYSDDAHYVVLAESLATGHGYRLINYPDQRPEPAFPPGWSLILTPLAAIDPRNYTLLKLVPVASYLLSIPLCYALFARRLPPPYIDFLMALIVLNPRIVGTSGMLMSEALYLCLSLFALVAFERWDRPENGRNKWLLLLAVALALVAQLVRSIGLTLLVAMGIYLLMKVHWKRLLVIAGIVLVAAVPQVIFFARRGGTFISSLYHSHIGWILRGHLKEKEAWTDFVQNGADTVGNMLLPIFGPRADAVAGSIGLDALPLVLTVLLLSLCLAGLIISLRRPTPTDLYTLAYSIILIVWIIYVGFIQFRMWIPLAPFMLYYMVIAIRAILTRFYPQRPRQAIYGTAVIALILAAAALRINIGDCQDPIRNRIFDLTAGAKWIQEHTSESAVVMARSPVSSYLYIDRKTVDYPAEDDTTLETLLVEEPDYIMVSPPLEIGNINELDEFTRTNLLPALEASPDAFELVYTNEKHNVRVFQVK